jgi:hypothetical protein
VTEKRILPSLTEEEYKKVADIINGAIVMMDIHGGWNEAKNSPIMEKHFPPWEKLKPAPPKDWEKRIADFEWALRSIRADTESKHPSLACVLEIIDDLLGEESEDPEERKRIRERLLRAKEKPYLSKEKKVEKKQ